MTSEPTTTSYVGFLVWKFPELMSIFGEHLNDNDGVILPHVFMAAVEAWAETLLIPNPVRLSDLLEELDCALGSENAEVVNMIDVSFVENLPYPDELNAEIRTLLPSRLKQLLRHG